MQRKVIQNTVVNTSNVKFCDFIKVHLFVTHFRQSIPSVPMTGTLSHLWNMRPFLKLPQSKTVHLINNVNRMYSFTKTTVVSKLTRL